jgi:hypothetical protein
MSARAWLLAGLLVSGCSEPRTWEPAFDASETGWLMSVWGIVGARRVERGWRTDRGRGDALRRHPLERAPHRARGAAARLGVRLWTGRCLGGRSHRDHPSLGRSRVLRGERGDDGGPLGHLGQRALRSLGGGRQRLSRSDGHAPSPRRCWLVDRHPAAAHARGGARALQGVGLERERRLGRRSAGRRPPLRWDPLERRAGGDGRRPDLGVGHRPRSRRVRGGAEATASSSPGMARPSVACLWTSCLASTGCGWGTRT